MILQQKLNEFAAKIGARAKTNRRVIQLMKGIAVAPIQNPKIQNRRVIQLMKESRLPPSKDGEEAARGGSRSGPKAPIACSL